MTVISHPHSLLLINTIVTRAVHVASRMHHNHSSHTLDHIPNRKIMCWDSLGDLSPEPPSPPLSYSWGLLEYL